MQACTIIARNYLPFARVLAESYQAHHPGTRLTALVIDDRDRVVDPSAEPFDVLHLDAIAPDRAELHRQALYYDVTELATAVKPLLLRHLLAQGHGAVVYLDPDICVYSPFDGVETLAVEHSIVLTPHTTDPMARDGRKPTEADILASGVFNLGFLAVGAGAEPFLDWWAERLRRDCLIDHHRMLFTDQRWIDFVPGYFRHHVLRDRTMNVAYWNVDQRLLTWSGSRWELDGDPLRFFHFSGFSPTHGHLLSRHQGDEPRVLLSERADVAALCADYAGRLEAAGLGSAAAKAPYGWDRLADGVLVDGPIRAAYRTALTAAEQDGAPEPPDPFDAAGAFVEWLCEPTGRADAPINRYLLGLWEHRPVLRHRFPKPLGAGADDYRHWVRHDASPEVDIPSRFMPPDGQRQAVPGPTQAGCNVAGYFRAELGVGEGGRLLLSILEAAGVPHATVVYADTVSRQDHPFTETGPGDAAYDVNILCVNADRVAAFAADMGPRFFAGRHTVGMWAWELEELPIPMRGGFDVVDEVWAVSSFAAASIAKATSKPVFALPHPIIAPVVPEGVTRADVGLPADRPVFLFLFDFLSVIERKNPLAVIDAFAEAFAPGEGPALVIKTINGHRRLADLERLRAAARRHPDIVLIDGYVSAPERAAMLALADCYVSLHRAEGFGLTLAEAMALGTPAIGTRYSGNLDFMTDENSWLVDASMTAVPPGCDPYPAGARWAEPDVHAAAACMRAVVDRPAEARARAERALADIAAHHTPSARAAFVVERLGQIRAERRPAPAPRTALDELGERLHVEPGTPMPASRWRRPLHRAALRITRPYWWGQRATEEAAFRALVEERAAREADVADLRAQIDALRAAAEPRPTVAGGIDLPVEPLTLLGPMEVTGWAFCSADPIVRIDVAVDGKAIGPARLGIPRRDVEAVHPAPEAVGAGFSFLLDPAALGAGAVEVAATAITASGLRLPLDPRRVHVASSPSPSEPVVESRPHLTVVGGRRDGPLHLLAFSHDLRHAGAQRYLADVLVRLRSTHGIACTVVAPGDGPLRAELEAAGIGVHVAPVPVDQPVAYQAAVDELSSWARYQRAGAVLVNTAECFAGVHVADRCGIPSLWAIHESWGEADFFLRWETLGVHPQVRQSARAAFGRASAVSFVCEATRRLYADRVGPDRAVVIPNAVPLDLVKTMDKAAARSLLGVQADTELVLCVGSLQPRKGQAVLARAARLLAADRPRLQVVLLGDEGGEYAAAVERYAGATGLGGRVRLVPAGDPWPWLAAADVAVCPSDNESLPGVVLEAMAAGVPVVGARTFGIPEVVEDGVTGFLSDANDVASLADAVRRALDLSAGERAAMTDSARRRVESEHDAGQRAEAVWRVLQAITTGAAAPLGEAADLP